ncbi:MAG: 1-acyl-sn-glycerol-3-phosphate acyltransferase [Granulosicoccus sp.]
MGSSIELPIWSVLLGLALASLWLIQHFLLPSARWIVRRRANKLIDEVNTRLALRIPSFKLTRRSVLVDRLNFHPRVVELVDSLAVEQDLPREALMRKVSIYAREIVPAFNALIYFKAAYWVARRLVHALYRVRLGFADDAALKRLGPESSVVFLMNHRSNMDYILATYLAAERTALSYAVGEWARIWPLQQLIRAMGGYFVRRDSGDPLYRRVLECYVQMAAEGGVPQAVFPEGKLTRNGELGEAKLGLLGYITRGFDPAGARDIVFIPVGINYDRVIEDRSLLRSAEKLPRRSLLFSLKTIARYGLKTLWQASRGKRFRNGYACVNFGEPVSLKQWMSEQETTVSELSDVRPLAEDLMQRIGNITPILPVALVTTLFSNQPSRRFSMIELKAEVLNMLERLELQGYRAYIPRGDYNYAVDVGVRMLTLRNILVEKDGMLEAKADEHAIINYYANSIAHLFSTEAPQQSERKKLHQFS